MTTPDILIQWANCMKEVESLKAENASLRSELEATRQHVPTVEKQWFSTAEAAKFIGVKETFFKNNRNKPGSIPFRKDGHRSVFYHRDELIKYAKTGKRCRLPKGDTDK